MSDNSLYMRLVKRAIARPGTTIMIAIAALVAIQVTYGRFGKGVEFFPDVEPDFGQVVIHAAAIFRSRKRTA